MVIVMTMVVMRIAVTVDVHHDALNVNRDTNFVALQELWLKGHRYQRNGLGVRLGLRLVQERLGGWLLGATRRLQDLVPKAL